MCARDSLTAARLFNLSHLTVSSSSSAHEKVEIATQDTVALEPSRKQNKEDWPTSTPCLHCSAGETFRSAFTLYEIIDCTLNCPNQLVKSGMCKWLVWSSEQQLFNLFEVHI